MAKSMTWLQKTEKQMAADKLIRRMLDNCARRMLDAGIPIRPDRVLSITLMKLSGTRAICYGKKEDDGELSFVIGIDEKIINHMDKPRVVEHVRNSVFHELLHTCRDCQEGHNEEFVRWSKFCDEKLGTRTLVHMESPVYYQTRKSKPVVYQCENCGNIYYAVKKLEDTGCEICSGEMERIRNH